MIVLEENESFALVCIPNGEFKTLEDLIGLLNGSYQEAKNYLLEKLDKGELEDVREHQKNLHDVANTLRQISGQMNSCNKCQEQLCVGIVGKDIKAKLVKKQQKDLQKR